MDKLLKPIEAAGMLNISRAALYIWIQRGLIKAVRLPTGKLRIPLSELDRVIAEANPSGTKFSFIRPDQFGREQKQ